jgi:prepilin-type N-terminal cleavage/methylation domain-containing protein
MGSASSHNKDNDERGFTLIELILVLLVIAGVATIITVRLGALNFWKEEAALRKLSETIVLLNTQAVMDQSFYRMEFDLEHNAYRIGVMRGDNSVVGTSTAVNLPPLQLELAALLSPSLRGESTMIPPPSYPSLAQPQQLPGEMKFTDVVTPRGKAIAGDRQENPFILFSPRSFSEFGVIHLMMGSGRPVTLMVNPWTGLAEVYREYKEFEWTLGKQKN